MRHAVLGVGGVGGLIAAALARNGEDVTLLLRPETLDAYPEKLRLESAFGNFSVQVTRAVRLENRIDVLWIAVKAPQLDAALQRVPASSGIGAVVPLLNGVDHIRHLRKLFGHDVVVPATIAVESERVGPGHIVHRSPFARLSVAALGQGRLTGVLAKLSEFGFECKFVANEQTLLWSKLAFLAPLALVSTASDLTTGGMAASSRWRKMLSGCVRESCAVARAAGATVVAEDILSSIEKLPGDMRSSMQKDVAAGRTPELDAIAGPIIRGAEAHGLSVATTRELVELVQRAVIHRV